MVIGLGYIGLPTAASFATQKIRVLGVDINKIAVDSINNGIVHIVEPELEGVVKSVVSEGFLQASMAPEPADAFLIAVPTPLKEGDHSPDLTHIREAVKSIAPHLKHGNLVVLESTSPIGTTEKVAEWLSIERPDLSLPCNGEMNADIGIAYCPERVLPGKTMHELVYNDRVIGGLSIRCAQRASELYKVFVKGDCILASSARAAEMTKLAENSFRDVNIAFANELSMICDEHNIDVWELINMTNRHPRVNILQPGPGVGGHCIAVDPWFIVSSSPGKSDLIKQARLINDSKPIWVLNRIQNQMAQSEVADVILYGLSYKADTDDLRESPAMEIYHKLQSFAPKRVYFCDPNVKEFSLEPKCLNLEEALSRDAIHVLLVEHKEFWRSRPTKGKIIDFKGIWGGNIK